jgi:hypothetical protein
MRPLLLLIVIITSSSLTINLVGGEEEFNRGVYPMEKKV